VSATDPVRYDRGGAVGTITMDDGKANVMTPGLLTALDQALSEAEDDGVVVVLAGRPGMFSAGYDRAMFDRTADEIRRTIRMGGEIVHRLLSFPRPVVVACTGHAIAQGAFVLLAADVRIGAQGSYRVGLNEVAIGLTIPHYGIEAARQRLTPSGFNHACTTGTLYGPSEGVVAGFFDELAEAHDVLGRAQGEAERLSAIDMAAHAATKLRVRAPALLAIRAGIDEELPVRRP